MVQTFMVVQCVSCEAFQVHQVKKSSNKWVCKVCGTKQSVIKKYYEGQAAECRKHVQQYNMRRGEMEKDREKLLMPPDEYERFGQDDEPADDGLLNAQLPYTVVQTKSKWSIFTSPPDSESDEERDDDVALHSPQEFELASKRAKRNTSISSLTTADSEPYSQFFPSTMQSSTSNHSLHSSASSCTNKKQGKQLVKGLKEMTGSKSAYNLDSAEFGTDNSKSMQILADSVAGLDSTNVSQMEKVTDDFMQGRRASANTTAPSTSKWHKFTSNSSSNMPSLTSFSTSDLNHL